MAGRDAFVVPDGKAAFPQPDELLVNAVGVVVSIANEDVASVAAACLERRLAGPVAARFARGHQLHPLVGEDARRKVAVKLMGQVMAKVQGTDTLIDVVGPVDLQLAAV